VTLRVLLAESGTENTLFLRDVLTELDGSLGWSDWVHVETSYADTCADTAAILIAETVDILLLNPDLRDCQGAETFRRIQAAAPHVPVILLVEPSAASLAERLIREGAQDFLLHGEIDCVPLARSIRNALERHRLLTAIRAISMRDPLTGVLTLSAFQTLADRDFLLAGRLSRGVLILVAELIQASLHNPQQRDLALVEAADLLRRLAGPAALVGRLSPSSFGVAVFDTEAEPIDHVRDRFHALPADSRIAWGAALCEPQRPLSLDTLLERAVVDLCDRAQPGASAIMAESADRSRRYV
jgi:GGDEF domain-containing protein